MKHDNNMKDYSLRLTDQLQLLIIQIHLVCDRANTQSVTVRKVVKPQLNYCNALVIGLNLQYRPVRREERGMFISSSLLIDVYALFF